MGDPPKAAPGAPAGVMNTALACATCAQASIYAALQGQTGNAALKGGAPAKPPDGGAKPPDAKPPDPPKDGAKPPDAKPPDAAAKPPDAKPADAKPADAKPPDAAPAPAAGAAPAPPAGGGDKDLPVCGPIPCKVVKEEPKKAMQINRTANYYQ